AAVFHPEGTRIASAGRDRAGWVWGPQSSPEGAHPAGATPYIWSLGLSPHGNTPGSGPRGSTLRPGGPQPLKTPYEGRPPGAGPQAAALRPEAQRLVERLWREKTDPGEVVEALRADQALGEPLRQAAQREVLRRALPPEAAPGNPHDPP